MKAITILAVLSLVVFGCNNHADELQQQNTALQNTNAQLSRDISARDEYIDQITTSINDVYTSVEDIKAKEKSLLNQTTSMESDKKLTREEMRSRMIDRISAIKEALSNDRKQLADLQKRISSSKRQYAGLQKMVESLKKSLDERDQSIADLGKRVQGLEQEVNEKNMAITQKDSVIGSQYRVITTAYYITGSRDQLEKMGIIKKEGGFLWGLLGSTSQLGSGFDDKYFTPVNKTVENTIQVDGKIDEIIPKRSEEYYHADKVSDSQSMLTIAQPDQFWKDKYLVIVTDKPSNLLSQR